MPALRVNSRLLLLALPAAFFGCMGTDVNTSGCYASDYYPGTERHSLNAVQGWVATAEDSLSSFGADVDEGSYTFARRKIEEGSVVDSTAIRPEEFINYFAQDYKNPTSTFGVELEAAPSLWRGDSLHLLRVGVQGKTDSVLAKQSWNITFLIDISGSMASRLDFVKSILGTAIDNMRTGDVLSAAVYSDDARVLLEPVTLQEKSKQEIKAMISDLRSEGSTNMAAGMRLGYKLNDKRKLGKGQNRVVVVSDGDANVGTTDADGILSLIKEHTDAGTTITTLGVGSGNYNANLMESLADKGNGNYYYLDSQKEAERVVGIKLASTMTLIARDLKIQVAFDPARVSRYRLIGYENRAIADSAFNQDTTDGGEISSGHHVTALYELVLKPGSGDLGQVHLRYKDPSGASNLTQDIPIASSVVKSKASDASRRHRFTQCVAEFAERLRRSSWAKTSYGSILETATAVHDPTDSADVEFLRLVAKMH